MLRAAGRRLVPHLWIEPKSTTGRRSTTDPYTGSEIARLVRSVAALTNTEHRLHAEGIVAVGLGAGADPHDLRTLRGTDVVTADDGAVEVHFTGARPRIVVALDTWAPTLQRTAAAMGSTPFIGTGDVRRQNLLQPFHKALRGSDAPHLSMSRLRTSWMLTLLELRTPSPVLAEAAGVTTMRVIEEVARFMAPIDDATARRYLRGVL